MARRFITYLFLFAFVLHASSRILIYFDFWLNQDFIAQNLCENKDKPQMECNGKCHLKKELKKDDERKEKENKQQVEDILFVNNATTTHFSFNSCFFIEKEQNFAFVLHQKTKSFSSSIFHPPTC